MTRDKNSESGRWDTFCACLAASAGALFLGLGDLFTNDNAATVVKMSDVLNHHLFAATPAFALFLLVVLGAVLAWIHEPQTRLDAFARGLSVFAVLAVTTPYDEVPAGLDQPFVQSAVENAVRAQGRSLPPVALAGSAFAAQAREPAPDAPGSPTEIGRATVRLRPADPGATFESATVTIRDGRTGRRLGIEKIGGAVFSIVRPVGSYVVEVEAPGFQRVQFDLTIGEDDRVYRLAIPSSEVPIFLQRLIGPAELDLTPEPRPRVLLDAGSAIQQPTALAWASDSLIVLESGRRLLRLSAAGTETVVDGFAPFRPLDVAAATVGGRELILVSLTLSSRGGAFNKLMLFSDGARTERVLPRLGAFTGATIDPRRGVAYLGNGESNDIYSWQLSEGGSGGPRYLLSVNGARSLGALAFDAFNDRLFAADPRAGSVFEIQLPDGAARPVATGIGEPAAIAYLPSLKRLLVADAARGRITSFGTDGTASVLAAGEAFRAPRGLTVDADDNIWVADQWSSRVLVFSAAGDLLKTVG